MKKKRTSCLNECYIYLVSKLFQEFKILLNHLPDLRTKLESAARASQTVSGINKSGALGTENKTAPTIKLKMDFSNFSS